MYYASVPTLTVRAECAALILINGRIAGECDNADYISVPLGTNGDYYIEMQPLLSENGVRTLCGVTRKFSMNGGMMVQHGYSDATLCLWPGSMYEIFMYPKELYTVPNTQQSAVLDAITPTLGGKRYDIVLYRDSEAKLSISAPSQCAVCYALGSASDGTLGVCSLNGQEYVFVRLTTVDGERLVLLDEDMRQAADVSGTHCFTEGGRIIAVRALNTVCAHEMRTVFSYENGGFEAASEETGFFTHEAYRPKNVLERAMAFAEANMLNLEAEALAYLSPELRNTLEEGALSAFFGKYERVQPPIGDLSGDTLALISKKAEHVYMARLFAFEHGEAGIENIREL